MGAYGKAFMQVDSPDVIRLCLNCQNSTCTGYCKKLDAARKRHSTRKAREKLRLWHDEYMTMTEISAKTGIPKTVLFSRMGKGYTLDEAVNMGPSCTGRIYTVDGESGTIGYWAERAGIDTGTLSYHVQRCGGNMKLGLARAEKCRAKRHDAGRNT